MGGTMSAGTTKKFTPEIDAKLYDEFVAVAERNGQTIHFMKADSEEVLRCVRGHTEIYIEVAGIGDLWKHVSAFKDRYRIRDLFERDYGMTEFHIEDPNGCLVFVGEATIKRR